MLFIEISSGMIQHIFCTTCLAAYFFVSYIFAAGLLSRLFDAPSTEIATHRLGKIDVRAPNPMQFAAQLKKSIWPCARAALSQAIRIFAKK
jgi:hypothetical protein